MSLDDCQLAFGESEELTLDPISEYELALLLWLCIRRALRAEIILEDGSKIPDRRTRMKAAEIVLEIMSDREDVIAIQGTG